MNITKETAKKDLEAIKDFFMENSGAIPLSIEYAIKALEPCEDAVSRKALYEALYEHFHEENAPNNTTEVRLGAVRNFVKNFPPVTPTQNWIPVSERLPELDVNINAYKIKKKPIMVSKPVYISYRFDGHDHVCPIPCILHSNGYWYIDDSLVDWVNLDAYDSGIDSPLVLQVTAWMPLLEPYKAESEGDSDE